MLHVQHFVIFLLLFQSSVTNNKKQTFKARFDTEKWLKAYDIVNFTVKFNSSEHFEHHGTPLCYLQFEYKGNDFTVGLVKTGLIPSSIEIRVDDHKIDSNVISKQLSLFHGAHFQDDVYIQCKIVLTNDGLDGMLRIGNESLIVEPLNKQNWYTRYDDCTGGHCKRPEVYSCILYRPEDIIDAVSNSYALPKYEIFSKHYTRNLTNTTVKSRKKRNAFYTDCTLHLVADHTFYQAVGNEDIITTISEILYLVTEANTVFRSTDFDGDGFGDNVGFFVSHISIFTTNEHYKMVDSSLTVYKYLDAFSEYDFSNVCLGIAFSSRDFSDGVLGLAWVASSSGYGAAGGICQRRIIFENTEYSLNTNIITVVNNGERVPVYKSALTLTHEFGHSFGSPHDDTADASCVPNNDFGNYIMYPYANDGSKPNHIEFSPCSIGYMFPVILNKGICFTGSTGVCGNGIKEEHEECDCGSSGVCDFLDPSCTPSDVSNSNPDPPCTVRRMGGCQCSSVSSPCCTASCQFAQPWKLCRVGGECVKPTYCNGTSGECPQITFESNEKLCNNNRKTCLSGKCIGSVCSLFNFTECDCDSGPFECHACCSTDNDQCFPVMINDTYITKSVGSPCRQMQGFCDKHTNCILQDPDSVVKRLNEVFSPKSMNEVMEWLQNHWYYVIAGTAGLLFIAGVFFATCRQRLDVQTSAFMYGQFMRIAREAEIQKQCIEERKKLVESKYKAEMEKVEHGLKQMPLTKAVARLKVLFPTAPNKELEKVMKMCSKEEMAVSLILMKGFPIRRISRPVMFEDETNLIN